MNRWKLAFYLCLSILVVSNMYWIYQRIDSGVSFTYLTQSYEDRGRVIESFADLVVEGAQVYSKKDILSLLRRANPDALIAEEEEKIILEGLVFNFKNEVLIDVKSMY